MTTVVQAGISDIGRVRGRNEDCLGSHIDDDPEVRERKGQLFVIADGVGGHGAGDVASQAAVKTLIESYYASHARPDKALKHAFAKTNIKVFDLGVELNKHSMQTTLSALLLVGNTYYIGHVGDSRIYRARPNVEMEQLTSDDSEVAELVRMRILAPEKVRGHARRNIITKSVGSATIVRPAFRNGIVRPGDFYMMCTDGLWEPVLDTEMHDIVTRLAPEAACAELVRLGIERQSTDNLTVQIIRVDEVTVTAPKPIVAAIPIMERLRRLFGKQPIT